jgi:predicted negative regulator of RcsB-dependent stress response
MTSPLPTEPTQTQSDSILEWIQSNTRLLTIGASIVVVAGAGAWFYSRYQENRLQSSAKVLMEARRSMGAGNAALAQTDLKRVIDNYGGTASGAEGAMLLAQMHFDQGKHADGIAVLEKAVDDAPASMKPTLRALLADAYAETGKLKEAAETYEAAAAATELAGEKSTFRAKAARTWGTAGDTARARTIWAELAAEKNGAVAAEARVRLGELVAKPVS